MSLRQQDPIRLLLVDSQQIVRLGLRSILERCPRIQVVGEVSRAEEALEQTRRLSPGLVVMDVRFSDGSGFELCRQIKALPGHTKVLVLTSQADDDTVLRFVSVGIDGYLLKAVDGERLIQCVESIADGHSVLDPAVTRVVLSRAMAASFKGSKSKLDVLSSQERRVLALVAEGKTNKEIGVLLGLSDKTVKNYLSNLMDKLQLGRRSQAAAYFVQHASRRTTSEP